MAKHTGIRKLSNGRFKARYFKGYDSQTGRRVYPAKTFDAERDAREWRAAEIASRGTSVIQGRAVTLSAMLDHWLSTKLDLRENSRERYQRFINLYIKPSLGHIKLLRLSPAHVEQWQAELLARPLSATTVIYARTLLHGALKSAQRKNMIRSNAVDNTDGPKMIRSKRYPLSVEEALRILEACERERHGLMFQVAAHCGLRPEEAMGLQWADLEIAQNRRGTLRVNRVVHHLKGGSWRFHKPKTASSERAIRFPAELAARLLDHRRTQLQQKLKAGSIWRDHDLVFTNGIGEPIRRDLLSYHFKAMIDRLGMPSQITMYSLRHFFVTFSLIAGVDAKTVSREAGHKNVSFTLDRYGHVLDEMHDAAADKRESLMKRRGGR